MLKHGLRVGLLLVVGLIALNAEMRAAHADPRDFPFTYEWKMAPKGSSEVEVQSTYNGEEKSFKQEFEVEYQVTDRLLVAPYVIAEQPQGGKYEYKGFKFESRYRLGDFKLNTFLPGLYLEYEQEKAEDKELEGKLILSRYGKDGSNISFNYIIKKALVNGAVFENTYSIGYARGLTKKPRGPRGGGEWIHDLSDGRIKAGPVLSSWLGSQWQATTGYVFALNNRNGNKGDFRLNFQYEF